MGLHRSARAAKQIPLFLALVLLATTAALWWGMFSGDGEIHLIYARNFLRGYPLQFNLHVANSGETSMGYMLVDALLMRVLGQNSLPVYIEILCLLELATTAFLTARIAAELGLRRHWAALAGLLVLAFPGNQFTALLGTENVLFAALVAGFVLCLLRAGWFDEQGSASLKTEAGLALYAGVLFWIRPEAAPLVAVLLVARLLAALGHKRKWSREAAQIALFGALFALSIAAYVVLFRHWAGAMPYGAGQARRLLSIMHGSVHLAGLNWNLKVLLRILSYFSITLPALAALLLALKKSTFAPRVRFRILAYGGVFFAFLAAWSWNLLPSVHFARYSIFAWPFGMVLAVWMLQWGQDSLQWSASRKRGIAAFLLVSFVGVAALETWERMEFVHFHPHSGFAHLLSIPRDRERTSAEFAQRLGIPVGAPANLAYQEVQLRYELTDNFQVISLDGITDNRLLRYFCNGWIDHDGYVIDTRVDYLMETPNYNRDASRWSLNELNALKVGESLARPGVVYERIQPDVVAVHRLVNSAADRPGGICPADARRTLAP